MASWFSAKMKVRLQGSGGRDGLVGGFSFLSLNGSRVV